MRCAASAPRARGCPADKKDAAGRALPALTGLSLVAFAANSILCRLALGAGRIDAASFTSLRLLAGAAVLVPLARLPAGAPRPSATGGSWGSGVALAVYALSFSFAYRDLTAGTGALLLFGAVQATMMAAGLLAGERPRAAEWIGWLLAIAGLGLLTAPGVEAPAPRAAALMALAGAAWGVYSLRGRNGAAPRAATADNFLRALPWALAACLATRAAWHSDARGALCAVVSGAVTSGLGYVAWYAALPGLGAVRAAIAQLAVPALAALGGVALLGEHIGLRLAASSLLILGGVLLAIARQALPAALRRRTDALV
jgi:drug/metabolite transporter (DMT)-like permease